jgi:hypothetical protein
MPHPVQSQTLHATVNMFLDWFIDIDAIPYDIFEVRIPHPAKVAVS